MKIIDLLNMIAKGEIPKKIKYNYNGRVFVWDEEVKGYHNQYENWWLHPDYSILNNEVEILENEEEIDIQSIKELEYMDTYGVDTTDIKLNRDMIIQLTRAVKQLDNKIKEKKC